MGLLSSIGEKIVDAVNSLLSDTGKWASSILDAGTHLYNKFVDLAYSIVTKDIRDETFSEFWKVIDKINTVVVSIASVLLVMMFLYTLVQSSLAPKQEVDVKGLIMDFIKLLFCNFLITQAINVVAGIFLFGTRLAKIAASSSGISVTDSERGLSEAVAFPMEKGVSGISGLLIVILSIIGSIIMVGCALIVVLEIYKRFFRIFVLIPFASISFSTSVMADGHGNEIFRGYLKNIIAASFESVVIVLCLVFCAALTVPKGDNLEQSAFMEKLFSFSNEELNIKTMEINSDEELEKFNSYAYAMCFLSGGSEMDSFIEQSGYKELGAFDMYTIEFRNGFEKNDRVSDSNLSNKVSEMFMKPIYPVTVITGRKVSLGGGLILILQAVFPMILTACAIKEAPMYASKVLGM